MALVTSLINPKEATKKRTGVDTALDISTGAVVGVLINDVWEIFQLPGYFVTAFQLSPDVNVGWDDIIQSLLIPLGVALVPFRGSGALAIGLSTGAIATKAGEQAGYRIQIIPHESPPPAAQYGDTREWGTRGHMTFYGGAREWGEKGLQQAMPVSTGDRNPSDNTFYPNAYRGIRFSS